MVNGMVEAILYSSLTGLSTLIGSVIVLFFSLTKRMIACSLGISAGVMLTVAYTTMLPTAFTHGGFPHLWIGMILAISTMVLLHLLPFSKVEGEGDSSHFARLGFFLALAVALHNAPEGAAIGIGFKTAEQMGHTLVLAMVIHNIPEGIGLAAPLIAAGRHPLIILLLSLFCAATLPLGTWVGMNYLASSTDVVSIGLVFAATTMIWIVICEICPKAFSLDKRNALVGVGIGTLFMYIIHLFH